MGTGPQAARDALIHRHLSRQLQFSALVSYPDGHGGNRLEDLQGEPTVVVSRGPDLPEKVLDQVDDLGEPPTPNDWSPPDCSRTGPERIGPPYSVVCSEDSPQNRSKNRPSRLSARCFLSL